MIRPATLDDLDALVALENACFDTDRLSRRNFRHILTKGHASTLVYCDNNGTIGYIMVLFNSGTSLARIYSIAVDPLQRGKGSAIKLVEAAEKDALDNDCVLIRMEVRRDNVASIALFEKMGYRKFGMYPDYYEDHMEALRYEKNLSPQTSTDLTVVPYYMQTLDFTCGPTVLMMAMHALDPNHPLDRREELRLWREATTIFMTAGHGGCGPYGLAVAGYKRGFDIEVFVNEPGVLLLDSVRSEEKKAVVQMVEEDFLEQLVEAEVPVHHRRITPRELRQAFEAGGIPIVLISSYRIYREKFPHWVVITGFDDRFVYVHDPFVDHEQGKTILDTMNMPILEQDFSRMSRYGKSGQRAAIIVKRKGAH